MIFLSEWSDVQLPEPARCPLLHVEYPDLSWSQADDRDSTAGRCPVAVDRPSPALLTDYRFPRLAGGVPVRFADYQAAMREAHDLRLSAVVVSVPFGSTWLDMPGTVTYWQYLQQAREELKTGVTHMQVRAADRKVVMNSRDFWTVYGCYRKRLRNNAGMNEFDTRGAIDAALTVAHLDAIRLG